MAAKRKVVRRKAARKKRGERRDKPSERVGRRSKLSVGQRTAPGSSDEGPSASEIVEKIQDDHGDHVGGFAAQFTDIVRLPTGIFTLDMATGGGIPRGRVTIVYGPEGCGKSALAARIIKQSQTLFPDQKCALVDVEGTNEKQFMSMWGVDYDAMIRFVPEYGEQAVDMTKKLLLARDIGVVIVDSIPALSAMSDLEASAEKDSMGKPGLIGMKLAKSTNWALNRVRSRFGRTPTLIYINQPRTKLGFVMGNPERMPGGDHIRFQSTMIIRLWSKPVFDKSVSKVLPYRRDVTGRIIRWKLPILATAFDYKLALLKHGILSVGDTDDWDAAEKYLKATGLLTKRGSKWVLFGEEYARLRDAGDRFKQDAEFEEACRSHLIAHLVENDEFLVAQGPDEEGGSDAAEP